MRFLSTDSLWLIEMKLHFLRVIFRKEVVTLSSQSKKSAIYEETFNFHIFIGKNLFVVIIKRGAFIFNLRSHAAFLKHLIVTVQCD